MSEPSLDEMMFLYAAGALDDEERQSVEQRLAAGESAARESLERAETVLAEIPLALEPRFPRPEVGDRIRARIRGELDAESSRPVMSRWSRAERWVPWMAAAALILLMLVPFVAWRLQRTTEEARVAWRQAESAARAQAEASDSLVAVLDREKTEIERRVEVLAREVAALRELNSGLREEAGELRNRLASAAEIARPPIPAPVSLAEPEPEPEPARPLDASLVAEQLAGTREAQAGLGEARRALELVRAPDAALIELVSANPGDRGAASVFWDRGLRHCYLHARNLAPTDGSSAYVLWIEYVSGRQIAVTQFDVSPTSKDIEAFADLPVGLGEIARTWITREGEPGGASPSGPTVLREELPELRESSPGPRRYRRRS